MDLDKIDSLVDFPSSTSLWNPQNFLIASSNIYGSYFLAT